MSEWHGRLPTHNGKWSVRWLQRQYALDKRQARRLRRRMSPPGVIWERGKAMKREIDQAAS